MTNQKFINQYIPSCLATRCSWNWLCFILL